MEIEDTFARFRQVLDFLRENRHIGKDKDLVELLGMEKGNLSRALKGTPRYFTEGFIKRFSKPFSDLINENWILTGNGDMIKPSKSLRPHFEQKVSAGFMTIGNMAEMGDDKRPMIPGLSDYDFTITVQGDSMEPLIMEGDVLACRKMNDRLNPPIQKICVIDNIDGGPVVKKITGVTEDSLVLYSVNENYPVRELPFVDVNGIAVVVGMVRKFLN